jgi:hypothetical protein
MPIPTSPLARLGAFRTELHACFPRRADALFQLSDALLCAQAFPSLPHLSLEPVHRRGWGSVYAALACGRIDVERLRDLLASHLPVADPLVFAVDVTTWPRCDAECSPERGYYYHPSRHSAGRPIIAGWAYQCIAHVNFAHDSWTAPVDARRLHPLDDTDQTTAAQIHALLGRLGAGGPVPLFVFDAGYDSAQLTLDLAETRVAVLVRLRSDRCFYADPPPRPPGATVGRAATGPSSTAPTRHLARPDRHPGLPGRPVRHRDRGRLEWAASQTTAPSRPRHPRAPADRARHRHPGPGRTRPRQDEAAQGAVAVVGRPRRAGPGPGLAGVRSQVRPRAHRPVRQADPGVDHPASAASRAGRPLDLAGAGRLHPAAPRPRGGGG